MSEDRDRIDAQIDAYLDGGLTDAQRAGIESGSDPRLAADLRLQHRIDERLRVLMAAPAVPNVSAQPVAAEVAGRVGPRTTSRRWMLAAAALLLCAIGAWAGIAQPWHAWMRPAPSPLAANAAYDRLVKAGFTPDWVCTTDEDFARYSKEKLGVALAVKPDKNVQLVGWTYITGLLKNEAQVLMAKVNDQPVLVVMGKANEDLTMHIDAPSPLHLHRVAHAGLVMYEITPRESMAVLPALHGPKCGN